MWYRGEIEKNEYKLEGIITEEDAQSIYKTLRIENDDWIYNRILGELALVDKYVQLSDGSSSFEEPLIVYIFDVLYARMGPDHIQSKAGKKLQKAQSVLAKTRDAFKDHGVSNAVKNHIMSNPSEFDSFIHTMDSIVQDFDLSFQENTKRRKAVSRFSDLTAYET